MTNILFTVRVIRIAYQLIKNFKLQCIFVKTKLFAKQRLLIWSLYLVRLMKENNLVKLPLSQSDRWIN